MSNQILALGNPDLGTANLDLPGAQHEVEEIKVQFPTAEVYVRQQATRQRLLQSAANKDIIHLATHAKVDELDPLYSVIHLASTEKGSGDLAAHEVYRMALTENSLTLLSACDTGLGQISKGDELWGFTRAFLSAGSSSLLVSLWRVDDAATAHLMRNFYKNLKTMTKVEALREAQLSLIRGEGRSDLLARRGVGGIGKLGESPSSLGSPASEGDRAVAPTQPLATSHPYFWAPFILVGDGQ